VENGWTVLGLPKFTCLTMHGVCVRLTSKNWQGGLGLLSPWRNERRLQNQKPQRVWWEAKSGVGF
jgi:hypothetical protein